MSWRATKRVATMASIAIAFASANCSFVMHIHSSMNIVKDERQTYSRQSSVVRERPRKEINAINTPKKRRKKNKYANFSKADSLALDPMDELMSESRLKLKELQSKSTRGRKNGGKMTSLEAVDDLLAAAGISFDDDQDVVSRDEPRERNKRQFPDTTAIDPYDPTTYGYIELGTIIGAHGVRGLMKLASITDFSEHRLCKPGTRHLKLPDRRSPREVQLVEGRPMRSDAETAGSDVSPTYLIRLETVDDREQALKMKGCVLYALEGERVDDFLEPDEYIVSDLVGMDVFLDDSDDEHKGKSFEELFVGNVKGVVLGSDMCATPGLGQDLLEVVLPRRLGGDPGDDLVLLPFVPEIVTGVDLNGKMVSVKPPGGLLDLSYRREEKVRIKGLLPAART